MYTKLLSFKYIKKELNISILVTAILTVTNCSSYAQKINYVGLNFTLETSSRNFQPGLGVLFERKISKRSGFETGLYYRTYELNSTVIINDATGTRILPFYVSERNLSIPILYKLYSSFINVSAGPTFDLFLGWKQKNKTSSINVDAYNVNLNLAVGIMAKASKSISLAKQFTLEPELRFNYIIPHNRSYVGIGIAGKYTL